MKGQTGFEFIVSIVIFITALVYSVFTIVDVVPAFQKQGMDEVSNSMIFGFSQYILFSGNFTDEVYVLNESKIRQNDIGKMFGLKRGYLYGLEVKNMSGAEVFSVNTEKFEGQTGKTVFERVALIEKNGGYKPVKLRVFIG